MREPKPVVLILDSSAAVAYTRGSIDVGETLQEIGDEDAVAGLPLPCLVAAAQQIDDLRLLEVLVGHRATVVLVDDPKTWRFLAATATLLGRADAASAAVMALGLDVAVLTGEPGLYADLDDGGLLIPIQD